MPWTTSPSSRVRITDTQGRDRCRRYAHRMPIAFEIDGRWELGAEPGRFASWRNRVPRSSARGSRLRRPQDAVSAAVEGARRPSAGTRLNSTAGWMRSSTSSTTSPGRSRVTCATQARRPERRQPKLSHRTRARRRMPDQRPRDLASRFPRSTLLASSPAGGCRHRRTVRAARRYVRRCTRLPDNPSDRCQGDQPRPSPCRNRPDPGTSPSDRAVRARSPR